MDAEACNGLTVAVKKQTLLRFALRGVVFHTNSTEDWVLGTVRLKGSPEGFPQGDSAGYRSLVSPTFR